MRGDRVSCGGRNVPPGWRLREGGLNDGPIGGQAVVDKRSAHVTGTCRGHVEHPDRRTAGKVEVGQRETPDCPITLSLEIDLASPEVVDDAPPRRRLRNGGKDLEATDYQVRMASARQHGSA